MIDIGYYIEAAIEWLTKKVGFLMRWNVGVESLSTVSTGIVHHPFYIFIPLTALLMVENR